ncbi:hypothetical protein LVO79_11900 [Roseivivax marinus]|jgi:hypothetical protein|uniref:hypothetical protein n=1 Tax=Roseivivax marinus TaxID=1379903 RepID=UPI001F04E124|nr:hypothetical protein [Roseivivax marinus]UMA63734.1 hypothetical protein LVO79_11900 [Roseivivax marinus]
MSLITIEDRMSELEADRDAIAETLRGIRSELHDLRARVEAGEFGSPTEAGKLLGDVRYWLKAARETETEIQKVHKARAGIAHDYGLDLEKARADIRCRLHRIRACCKS